MKRVSLVAPFLCLALLAQSGSPPQYSREGKLLLPLRRGARSKIRLSIGGVETDLLAETDLETEIPAQSTVLVVGMRGLTALVEPTPAALNSGTEDNQDFGKEES